MTRTRSLLRVALVAAAAAALLGGFGLATPAAAQGVIGTGNGRAGAILALVLGLVGMVLGRLALARSSRTG